ncbi:MAG: hypothetical protein C0613_09375 [Desulfobulbaceae bacterium]|nr:MAG: hypothetical protein C0613_09375 [Desulfobulbaceae bacterium]
MVGPQQESGDRKLGKRKGLHFRGAFGKPETGPRHAGLWPSSGNADIYRAQLSGLINILKFRLFLHYFRLNQL